MGLHTAWYLDGETVAVPAKATRDKVASLCGVARDNILDSASEDVAIVRQASSEWWAIIKGVPEPQQVTASMQLASEWGSNKSVCVVVCK